MLVEATAGAVAGGFIAVDLAFAHFFGVAGGVVVRDFFSPAEKLRSSVRLMRLWAYIPSRRNSAALTAISGFA